MPKTDLIDLKAERICLIKPSALGDVVQTLPLLPMLRERFPNAHVSWVINRELREILEGNPGLDEVISFDRRGSWREWGGLLRQLRRARFDLVLDLQGLMRTAIMTMATAAEVRVGLETSREGANLACTHILPDSGKPVPAHLRYWRVAEAFGMGEIRPSATFAISQSDEIWVGRTLAALPGPILAIHPGARWQTKQWPIEKFAAVASKAMRKFGFSIVIVGSRGEVAAAAQLAQTLHRLVPAGSVLNLAGTTSLKQLTGVLSKVDLLLCNDSGPMHLAAAVGTPLVSVFLCTSPVRSGPGGTDHALIAAEVPCAGSYCKVCPNRGSEHLVCMEDVTVERVWFALGELIESHRAILQPVG